MEICKMKNSDWYDVKRIYKDAIATKKFTVVSKIPGFKAWNEAHHKKLRFVAKIDGKIAGFIAVNNYEAPEISVYVDEGHKRMGIGSALLEMLKGCALNNGFNRLKSLIFYNNIPSILLHEKMGFTKTDIIKKQFDEREIFVYEWSEKSA